MGDRGFQNRVSLSQHSLSLGFVACLHTPRKSEPDPKQAANNGFEFDVLCLIMRARPALSQLGRVKACMRAYWGKTQIDIWSKNSPAAKLASRRPRSQSG